VKIYPAIAPVQRRDASVKFIAGGLQIKSGDVDGRGLTEVKSPLNDAPATGFFGDLK
jgi:hypothetical protein